MKIKKDWEIEPCCDKAKEWVKYFFIYNDEDAVGAEVRTGYYDDIDRMPLYFCPFCGAKTEVEK